MDDSIWEARHVGLAWRLGNGWVGDFQTPVKSTEMMLSSELSSKAQKLLEKSLQNLDM